MSFRGNGQHDRYGYVPPAQYGPGSSTNANAAPGLQRQSSFDNGDDAALFGGGHNGRYQPGPTVPARPSQAEYYAAQSPLSPAQNSVGSMTPALSGYQHQFQPSPGSVQSPQVQYNPQHFPRSQSQSQAQPTYRPQPYTTPTISHQPYNPAAYPAAASGPARHSTVAGYGGHNSPSQYGSAAMPQPPPQSPGYHQSSFSHQQYVPQARPSPQTIYEQSPNQAYHPPSNSAPLPPRQNLYSPPTSSSGYSGDYGQDYGRTPTTSQAPYPDYYDQRPTSSAASNVHRSGSSAVAPISMPMGPNSIDAPSGLGLQRHPTLRPLPGPPAHDDSTDDDEWNAQGRTEEDELQERLFSDILNASSSSRTNGDLLDSELQHLNRYDSKASTLGTADGNRYGSSASTLNQDPNYDFDDESDLEAAAGLEAMRLAEEQDARGGPGSMTFGPYDGGHPLPQPQISADESSDSDYKHQDLSLMGGGYAGHMSYGDDPGLHTGHSSEMEDQSRPLPTAQDFGRSDSYQNAPVAGLGGMTDYSIPGGGSIHPFPAFEAAGADSSAMHIPGPPPPSSHVHQHRLSFDEGDEHMLQSRVQATNNDSPERDDMPELFYHPGMSAAAYNRPLPSVPTMAENRTPQLQQAGAYRNQLQHSHSYSSSTESRPYVPSGPDSYSGQSMLAPGGQYVPRSTSLNSHSSTPQTVPPTRSKTDAEERQARQKATRQANRNVTLDGYSMDTPQSSMPLDLPALPDGTRRKKFSPARLSSSDFKKCAEPWALSGIATWIREMAGGETGEGESDLRQKTVEDGLVALFTHKVPTMNTADAETLSQKVVKAMLEAGILLPEEEWVKFGQGSISGVLWQLTGSGCYSPKLHEHEIPGRCYSHHCTRTLKKINLQTQQLEPQRKTEDWVTFFKVTKEMIEGANKKEIERQNILHEIVTSEDLFIDHIDVLRLLYRDDLRTWQPPIISANKITRFITSVFGKVEAIKEVNENHLLAQLKYRQKEQGPWILGFSDIFREWIRRARAAYVDYAAGFPYAVYLVRREADRNLLFRQFLDQARDNKRSNRLDWNTYLKAPITRLQRYTLLLQTVLKNMTQDTEEKAILSTAIEEIKAVTLECDAKVDEQSKKVEMIELQGKLILRPGMERVELNLEHLGRELIYKGDLQRPGTNRFTWLDTHAILFDNYLVLAKIVIRQEAIGAPRKEIYDVSKVPIPMQLLVLESSNDDPVVKSSVKGIGAVTTVNKTAQSGGSDSRVNLNRAQTNGSGSLEHTQSSISLGTTNSGNRLTPSVTNDADARAMYPFRVKHLGQSEVYTLYASSAQIRQTWCEKIIEAKTRHAAALYDQKAEPFRLNVMADTAFAYDSAAYMVSRNNVSVQGTPLDRAIRKMENTYPTIPRPAPVCRSAVNCATAFTIYGKSMVAIGTNYGVFTAEANNPRGWTRSIQTLGVTQIAILEEFSLCLIIADKALIAYHLDLILPPSSFPAPASNDSARRAPQKLSGTKDVAFFATARMKDRTLVFYKKRESLHSTFKVLEPVFQKSSEKKRGLFSVSKKFGAGNTEFFREFDEFYIPTECFTINLFHTYIAISTLKGFELMTLDKKVPMSIPDMKNPSIAGIATRLQGQKPLGMFRLSEAEFLLCYEECGVYVDKHGEVSRSVILEFVGRAKSAAMYGAYLVLFDSDFVEVRNAENGRLRQVIAGSNVKCLDYGVNPLGAGAQVGIGAGGHGRTLKLVMAHPEIGGAQVVLEMVLNEGSYE